MSQSSSRFEPRCQRPSAVSITATDALITSLAQQPLDHQSKLLPAILPLSRLPVRASCDGRFFAGTLPGRAVGGDGATLLAELGRKLATMLHAARADLAAVAR